MHASFWPECGLTFYRSLVNELHSLNALWTSKFNFQLKSRFVSSDASLSHLTFHQIISSYFFSIFNWIILMSETFETEAHCGKTAFYRLKRESLLDEPTC